MVHLNHSNYSLKLTFFIWFIRRLYHKHLQYLLGICSTNKTIHKPTIKELKADNTQRYLYPRCFITGHNIINGYNYFFVKRAIKSSLNGDTAKLFLETKLTYRIFSQKLTVNIVCKYIYDCKFIEEQTKTQNNPLHFMLEILL